MRQGGEGLTALRLPSDEHAEHQEEHHRHQRPGALIEPERHQHWVRQHRGCQAAQPPSVPAPFPCSSDANDEASQQDGTKPVA